MAKLKEEYEQFLKDIESNIKNPEDLQYIKKRFEEFVTLVLNDFDSSMAQKEQRLENIEKNHEELLQKMTRLEQIIQNIEKDIYSDEGFDFEIVCPYCNYEFIIDVDENKTEVQCPECKNVIELDWTGDVEKDSENLGCSGSCSHCSGCDDIEQENNEEDDDDDM